VDVRRTLHATAPRAPGARSLAALVMQGMALYLAWLQHRRS
jgi:hypothetical protein